MRRGEPTLNALHAHTQWYPLSTCNQSRVPEATGTLIKKQLEQMGTNRPFTYKTSRILIDFDIGGSIDSREMAAANSREDQCFIVRIFEKSSLF